MKSICLIYPPQIGLREPTGYPPLGLLYIASALQKENIPVSVVSLAGKADVEIPKADFYGISMLSANAREVKELCKRIRKEFPDSKIILGGPHCTALPEAVLNDFECDYVVDGEGEEITGKIIRGEVEEGIVKTSRIYNLDGIAFPDISLLPFEEVFNKTGLLIKGQDIATTIITSRGCPYHCSFCCKIKITDGVRYRSPRNIFEELEEIREKYGCTRFRILDDAFTVDRPRVKELAELLKGKGYSFCCILRADTIQDSEMINYLKDIGIEEVSMGVESADPNILRTMNKRETIDEIENAINICKLFGIRTKVFLIEGLPGETEKSTKLTMAFMSKNKPHDYTLSKFTPLPGSDIWNHPEKYGINLDDYKEKWFYPDENKSEFRLWLESRAWKE